MDPKQIAAELAQGAQAAVDQHSNLRDPANEARLDNLYVHVKARQLIAVCQLAQGAPAG